MRLLNHRYDVLARLGEGVLGEVFHVRDRVARRDVALKLIRDEAFARDQLRYLRHEFRLMSDWRHDHVARVYDFERLLGTGKFFFTEEMVFGQDFRSAVKGMPLPGLAGLAAQLCRALAFVHSRDVVHCDLKPRNTVVEIGPRGPHLKLIDFHLAREGGRAAGPGLEGTLGYMAPEMLQGLEFDRRADLYALGVMLYEALAGELPYVAATPAEMAREQAETAPRSLAEIRADLPMRFVRLVHALLERDPDRRPETAGEVAQELGRCVRRELAPETPRTRAAYVASTRCAGREVPLGRLRQGVETWVFEGWAEAEHAGTLPPRAFLIEGSPGAGRTRLLREFRVRCQARGVHWISGACRGRDAAPYAPWLEVLESLVALERAAAETRGWPLARGIVGGAAEGPAASALDFLRRAGADRGEPFRERETRLRAMERSAEAIRGVATGIPCVVVVEDLHLADGTVLETWEHLVRVLGDADRRRRPDAGDDAGSGSPLLLLCGTVRIEAEGAGVETRLRAAGAEVGVTPARIVLEPISEEEVAALLRGMAEWERLSDALVRRVWTETAGHPLHVEELMKFFLEEGILRDHRGRWFADEAALARLEIPRDAVKLFSRRVGHLSADARRALDWLALCEDPAPEAAIRAAARMTEDRWRAAVADLRSEQLVIAADGDPPTLRLAHLPYQRDRVRRLGAGERRARHARLAAALEAAYGAAREEHAGELAAHWRSAGPRGEAKARRYAAVAARRCEQALAYRDAIGHLEFLRSRLARDASGHRRLPELYERMGDLLLQTGQIPRAMACYRAARRGYRAGRNGGAARKDDRVRAARLEVRVGRAFEAQGNFRGALRCFRRALDLFRGRDGHPEAARIRLHVARLQGYRFSDYRAGIEAARRALAVLARKGSRDDVVSAHRTLSIINTEHGRLDEALEREQAILDLVGETGSKSVLAGTWNGIGLIHLVRADWAEGRRALERALGLAEALETPGTLAMILNNLGFIHEGLGEYPQARERWERALAIGERIGDRRRIGEQKKNLGGLGHRTGDLESALRLLREALAGFTAIGLPTEAREAHLKLAEAYVDLGRPDLAAQSVERGTETGSQNRSVEALSRLVEGRVRLARGRPEEAEEALQDAKERYGALDNVVGRADALIELARAALRRGEPVQASARVGAAENLLGARDLAAQRAEIGLLRAETALAQSGPTDLPSAWQSLREALQRAERLGTPWLLWRVLFAIARHCARAGKREAARAYVKDAGKVLDGACARVPADLRDSFYAPADRTALRRALLADLP